jgi:hypothetical protein
MSRSFIRTWATVVTIMALACFVFVQPMPEYVVGGQNASEFAANPAAGLGQLTETPPFVDTVFSGKTFSPFATLPAAPVLHIGASRPAPQAFSDLRIPNPPPNPLIRPG